MDCYEHMYFRLFNRITDALNALSSGQIDAARDILIRAQQECEELYISSGADEDKQS